jgi:adenylate kinase
MHLIILGPQGSGKGTQAAMLAEACHLQFFSMGDRLRKEVADATPVGKQIKEILDRGDLVPSELTNRIVGRFAREADAGYIIDGYPRSMEQANFLDVASHVDCVIVLDVPDNVAVERLSGRRQCPRGHNYHVAFKPPQKQGVCDIDGLPLTQRSDDTEAAIRNRLAIYHKTTKEVIDHYGTRVLKVNGAQGIPQVQHDIMKGLKDRKLLRH